MTHRPLVSIVMPSFNQAEFIERSVDSVFSQSYSNVELIIADGGSTDGTADILHRLSADNPALHFQSARDNGPADALNSALRQVRGELVGWLNSDDLYMAGAIERAVHAFAVHPDWILCYGHGEHVDTRDRPIGPYPTGMPHLGIVGFAQGCFICQPTVFFKAALYRLLGPLDESLKTSFDYDYWLRAFRMFPERIGFISAVQAQSRLHDGCITVNMRRTVAVEGIRLSHEHLGRAATHWLTTYLEDVAGQTPEARGFGSLADHARDFLDEIRAYLDAGQIASLQTMVEHLPQNLQDAEL